MASHHFLKFRKSILIPGGGIDADLTAAAIGDLNGNLGKKLFGVCVSTTLSEPHSFTSDAICHITVRANELRSFCSYQAAVCWQ